MYIHIVHPNFIVQRWAEFEPFLARPFAVADAEFSLDQIRSALVYGTQTLFVVYGQDGPTGAGTIAFEDYPNARIAVVTTLGGKGIVNPEAFSQVKEWCRMQGATHIRGFVRDEIAKLMQKTLGMTKKYTVMESPL